MAFSDRELLARLVKCEAGGEGEVGMQAVATVVMNRVHVPNGEYQRIGRGSLRNVVFQTCQFTCVKEYVGGEYNAQNIYNINPDAVSYYVADWALAGNKLYNLGSALWFYNPFSPTCSNYFPTEVGVFTVRIGKHCFYNPTELYDET